MKIKSFIRDLHAVAQAKADGDQSLLETPSGKIKQDTFFERAIGLGKQLIAAIQGKSYERKTITTKEATEKIKERFNKQLPFFNKIKPDEKKSIEATSEIFISSFTSTRDEDFLKNPQAVFLNKLQVFSTSDSEYPTDPGPGAHKNLLSIYSDSIDKNKFKIKSKLLEEKYENLSKINAVNNVPISVEELKRIDDIATLAEQLMENPGETMNDAMTIARLMCREELAEINDKDLKYKIAKAFADHHLRRSNTTAPSIDVSSGLTNTKNIIQLRKNSEECFRYLKHHRMGHKDSWPRLSILISLKLQHSQSEPNFISVNKHFNSAKGVYSSQEAHEFERALSNHKFDENLANVLLQDMQ